MEFHSHMCSTCKAFQPTWRTLADLVQKEGHMRCGRVSIDEEAGLGVAEKTKALEEGVPSLMLFLGEGAAGVPVYTASGGDDEQALSAAVLQDKVDAAFHKALEAAGREAPSLVAEDIVAQDTAELAKEGDWANDDAAGGFDDLDDPVVPGSMRGMLAGQDGGEMLAGQVWAALLGLLLSGFFVVVIVCIPKPRQAGYWRPLRWRGARPHGIREPKGSMRSA